MAATLGPLEQRVMSHLWLSGTATVGDVLDALNAVSDRKLAYTTVMTVLVRLQEKGIVDRALEGHHFRYTAAFREDELAAEMGRRELMRLIERHGADGLASFAADLVGADSELTARLRTIADEGTET